MLTEISNEPRDYAWGSPSSIAELQGRIPTGAPEAEVWFGDHPGSPARLADGRTLDAVAAEPLTFLVKLLAAGAPLSIQAHPSKAQAEAGFAREEQAGVARDSPERNYKDDNHKPEILVAVSERFAALAGLRDLDATRRLVAGLGEGAAPLAARLEGDDDAAVLRGVLEWLLSGEADVDALIAAAVAASVPGFDDELAAVRRIAELYPGDPGVIVALLLNLVLLARGEALYAPAGTLHAYLDGLGVEVMAASDNVLRGGLTPKHIDVAELLSVLDTTPSPPPVLRPRPVAERVEEFAPGIPDFRMLRVTPIAGDATTVALAGPAIAVAVEGELEIRGEADAVTLTPGRAAFATVAEKALTLEGEGVVYLAVPGASGPRHADRAS